METGGNAFTKAAMVDLGKTPRDNWTYQNTQTIFHKPCRQRVNCTESIRLLFQQLYDINLSEKCSNVSIMDMQDSSISGLACEKVHKWNPLCIYLICFDRRIYLNNGPYLYLSWYYLEGQPEFYVILYS